jgi:ComF family protein
MMSTPFAETIPRLGRALWSTLLGVLAPVRCIACAAFEPEASGYCAECGAPEPLLDVACHIQGIPVFAGARYSGVVSSAIQRFKYRAAPELSRALAPLAARGIDLLGIEPRDLWVPVPLHPVRLAERGYNQAALLARELARSLNGRVDARHLLRLRDTEQQAKADRRGRIQNVAAAFAARSGRARILSGQRIVLVDDVVTTGATLGACIAALRAAGEPVAGCLTIAHAEPSPRSREASAIRWL